MRAAVLKALLLSATPPRLHEPSPTLAGSSGEDHDATTQSLGANGGAARLKLDDLEPPAAPVPVPPNLSAPPKPGHYSYAWDVIEQYNETVRRELMRKAYARTLC